MKKDKFPGFNKCLELIRKSDPQLQEDGFHWLLPRANEFINELITEFKIEKNIGIKSWLLELIAESKASAGFEILKENLLSENESLRDWAIRGLENLDSKKARTELYKIRSAKNI